MFTGNSVTFQDKNLANIFFFDFYLLLVIKHAGYCPNEKNVIDVIANIQ